MSVVKNPRLNLYIPLEMQEEIKLAADAENLTTSELMRRIVDEWRDKRRQHKETELRVFTREEMQMILTNRLMELTRLAARLERDVLEIEDSAKKEGLSVVEYVKKHFGIVMV
jgi:Ribbon-helix-helix protein, copG family